VNGWESALVNKQLDATIAFGSTASTPSSIKGEATVFNGWPPGIPPRHADVEGAALRAGLRVPLVAQHEVVGLLIFHSTLKPRFLPREVALLQTFANTSALALQRAQLIESLHEK